MGLSAPGSSPRTRFNRLPRTAYEPRLWPLRAISHLAEIVRWHVCFLLTLYM
jgi:hypothetical protein